MSYSTTISHCGKNFSLPDILHGIELQKYPDDIALKHEIDCCFGQGNKGWFQRIGAVEEQGIVFHRTTTYSSQNYGRFSLGFQSVLPTLLNTPQKCQLWIVKYACKSKRQCP